MKKYEFIVNGSRIVKVLTSADVNDAKAMVEQAVREKHPDVKFVSVEKL